MILISLMPMALTQAQVNALWGTEKCKAVEQIPNALVQGTIGRVMVLSSDDTMDLHLMLKINETGEIKSLPMAFLDGTEKKPRWNSGSFDMEVDFQLGHYLIYKASQKILTIACE